jgi:CubicO group peptidase (beta-lactamase class C family)
MKKLPVLLVGILVCSGLGAVTVSTPENGTLGSSPLSTVTSVGDSDDTLISQMSSTDGDMFDSTIELLMNHGHFPSVSACVIHDDRVVWSGGYGFRDMEQELDATEHTVYQIASVTKTVTGTALMQLYDQGLFALDDDVNGYLPFDLRNPGFPEVSITFRMLLSHASSLRNAPGYWDISLSDEGPPFSGYPSPWLEDYLVPGGRRYNPEVWDSGNAPGEQSVYANINFDLIAYLVELISGEPFYDYCEQHIFIPLTMKNTSFCLTDFDERQVAVPYYWNPSTNSHERSRNLVFIHYPAGGLFTSVADLARLMIAHMNGGVSHGVRILEASTVEEMHRIQPPGNKYGFYYGLAWLTMSRSMWIGFEYPLSSTLYFPRAVYSGHGGDINSGIHTRMLMKLSGDTAIIFFINTHRIHRAGWNSAELLTELLFTKANEYQASLLPLMYAMMSLSRNLPSLPTANQPSVDIASTPPPHTLLYH